MDRYAAYEAFSRPYLMGRLRAIGLDVEYHRAEGDRLYYRDDEGNEVEVLDFVGGLGAALLGHNHPDILATARALLDEQRPFHAQASVRGEAGVLCERLSDRVGQATGRTYVVTLANSGTEAIEAAIKHAEMERRTRAGAIFEGLQQRKHQILVGLGEQTVVLPEELFKAAARRFRVDQVPSFDDLLVRISRQQLDLVDKRPLLLALEGAFHGKSTGSVQLTYQLRFRAPWHHVGPDSEFLPLDDPDAIDRAVARATLSYPDLELTADGTVRLVEKRFVNIAAAVAEPIQGEGGVREVPDEVLRRLRRAATEAGFPLILDEIQSGMGRTGAFLASQASGVVADYYTLAKTLSGGLCKISALLVDAERYLPEFGYSHTSTYADDHHASAIANTVLDILERDDVASLCTEKGAYLRERLDDLAKRFPGQIQEVRGRGLMVGIELKTMPESSSALIRVLSEQDRLGQFLAGYFLREERIRVLTTLSATSTMRIQPSAFVSPADLDRFCAALERALVALRDSDAYLLARHAAGHAREPIPTTPRPGRAPPAFAVRPGQAHVGFLGHFLEPNALKSWDTTLSPFSEEDCRRFLAHTEGAIEPFVVKSAELQSIRGHTVAVTVIGIPFSPEQALESLRNGSDWIGDLIHRGVELARRRGCSVLGLGGYTSIITHNCRDIVVPDLAITSGNSLTAAAALDAARQATERLGIDRVRLGVVGATGNIGQVLAEVASDHIDDILLIGRAGARRRLDRAADTVYGAARVRAARGDTAGLAARMAPFADGPDRGLAARIRSSLGDQAPIRHAEELSALRSCNLILAASNASEPILLPEHLGAGPIVVVDVAVPTDVSREIAIQRPDVLVLRGGMVKAPLQQELDLESVALRPGELYGCLAETLVLGLAGLRENYSYGALSAPRIRQILDLARMHGFEVEENPMDFGSPHV